MKHFLSLSIIVAKQQTLEEKMSVTEGKKSRNAESFLCVSYYFALTSVPMKDAADTRGW